MNRGQAKRLAILSVVLAVGITTVKQVRAGEAPSPSIYVGGAIAALALTLAAEASPQIAGGLSAVLVVGVLLTDGVELANTIQAALGGRSTSRPTGGGSGGGGSAAFL